ncbi:tRNA lysidine(34) synthetase TilS [Macrococcus brunensis]|uniref:tRNA lysidine(34) synthetase TilS n=1 Tax=Macrococcus brunensis TaxID=198483 RepID=UPI001EF0DB07|nr:tRNA lysidine(34) synthetase TilS [Macrococcus brunensis]ULG71856.1 tRNA lysidine(34) synthetase TilS [Macrococcus brunensis]
MEINWKETDRVAVAVSGGVDSMVLLDKVRRSGHYKTLSILHVHHGLRAESDAEAAMIVEYCGQYELPFHMTRVPSDYFNPDRSIQNEARDFRYRFFDNMSLHFDCLLTAHHRDDQIETVLFRLFTGRSQLQPLGISQLDRGYPVYRPLLRDSKASLYHYAARHQVPFMEDTSNEKSDYTRNAIRHQLIPVINQIEGLSATHLNDLADWQSEVLALIKEQADRILAVFNEQRSYNRQLFNTLNPVVKRQVLMSLIENHAASHAEVSRHYLDEIIRVIGTDKAQASYPLTDELQLEAAYDQLYLVDSLDQLNELMITRPGQFEFNGFMIQLTAPITDIIRVRVFEPGDYIIINQQHQKLSRIFINKKIPRFLRERMPVVTVNEEIIAVGNLKKNHHPFNQHLHIKFKGAE